MAGNADTLKAGYDAFNRGDIEGAQEAWADDIRWEGSNSTELPGGGTAEGKDQVVQLLGRIFERFESFSAPPDEWIEQDDTVVVLGHTEGRTKEGKEIKAPYVHIWRMSGGKAQRVQLLTDTLQMAQAMGIA